MSSKMIKFLAPSSPETRVFSSVHAAGNLAAARQLAARVARRGRRAVVEAPLDAQQTRALAAYDTPTFTQGGIPCNRASSKR